MPFSTVGAGRLIERVHAARIGLKRRDMPLAVRAIGVAGAANAFEMIGRENTFWEPLAKSTVREKKRLGYTGRISQTDPLFRTGKMRAGIRAHASGLHAVVEDRGIVSEWQELGTRRMPARPFVSVGLTAAALGGWRFIADAWRAAWE